MIKKILITVLSIIFLLSFLCSCSVANDSDEEFKTTPTYKTRYSYDMKADDGYYHINEYYCIDTGNNTYEVYKYALHRFSASSYKGRSGDELYSLVESLSISPSVHNSYSLSADKKQVFTDSDGTTYTYFIPAGLTYWSYSYW